jgi:hypothetical protein
MHQSQMNFPENQDLFVVVRDPFERMLSEFIYVCKKEKKPNNWDEVECDQSKMTDKHYFNQWLQKKLHYGENRTDASGYLIENGHYTPQYDFVVAPGDVRVVDHVLQINNVGAEFGALMKAYGLDLAMPEDKHNTQRSEQDLGLSDIGKGENFLRYLLISCRAITYKNALILSAVTERMIREKYHHDFDLLKT